MKNSRIVVLFSLVIVFLLPTISQAQDIRLIIRGVDFGMIQGSILAFEKAFNEGGVDLGVGARSASLF